MTYDSPIPLASPGDQRQRPIPSPADEELARLAKALGHPLRVAIVRLLARRGECICGQIVEHLPAAQATVSQHLKILKQVGLLHGSVDGPRVCYCLDRDALERIKLLLKKL